MNFHLNFRSEKMGKCKSPNANPWETRYINLSLHYLEQVLLALGQPGRVHIPYRNSVMTALLRNSLGGNCITSMIATFSLSVNDMEVVDLFYKNAKNTFKKIFRV